MALPLYIPIATAKQLEQLEKIGKVKAASIVSYREKVNCFPTIEELSEVSGVSIETWTSWVETDKVSLTLSDSLADDPANVSSLIEEFTRLDNIYKEQKLTFQSKQKQWEEEIEKQRLSFRREQDIMTEAIEDLKDQLEVANNKLDSVNREYSLLRRDHDRNQFNYEQDLKMMQLSERQARLKLEDDLHRVTQDLAWERNARSEDLQRHKKLMEIHEGVVEGKTFPQPSQMPKDGPDTEAVATVHHGDSFLHKMSNVLPADGLYRSSSQRTRGHHLKFSQPARRGGYLYGGRPGREQDPRDFHSMGEEKGRHEGPRFVSSEHGDRSYDLDELYQRYPVMGQQSKVSSPASGLTGEHTVRDEVKKRLKKNKPKNISSSSSSSSSSSGTDTESDSETDGRRRRRRKRSRSPQLPKMSVFTGDSKLTWESFIFQFERISDRHGWKTSKKVDKLIDCLSGSALEYVNRMGVGHDFKKLKKALKHRFSCKDAPMAARRQLQFIKQKEEESLEQFSQRTYFLTLDGYSTAGDKTIQQLSIETFLRGCRDKEAAKAAMEKEPRTLHKALKYVKASAANQKAIFGSRSSVYHQRQAAVSESGEEDEPEYDVRTSVQDSKPASSGNATSHMSDINKITSSVLNSLVEGYLRDRRRNRSRSPTPTGGQRSNSLERITCFSCRQKGHFERNCPEKSKQPAKSSGQPEASNS
jgi:competence ComEA-like helix-hairpin-helix protein